MPRYLVLSTDSHSLSFEVIVNGDAPAVIASASVGAEGPIPPKTVEQKLARKNELKAKSTMLLAILDEHLLKFMDGIIGAMSLWDESDQDLEQIDNDDLGIELSSLLEGAMFTRGGQFARECMAPRNQGNRNGDNTRRVVPVETPTNTLVVTDGMGSSSSSSSDTESMIVYELNDIHMNKSEVFESVSDRSVNESEEDNNQVNDRYKAGEGYHAVPPSYTRNFMPPRPDMSFVGKESMEKHESVRSSAPVIEDWESNSDDDYVIRPSVEQNKPRKFVFNNEGKATSQREVRPVWNNAQRVNHQNFSNNLTHPHPRRNFVPSAVMTNSGKVPVNTAKQSFPRAAISTSTARYVNIAASRPTMNGAKPSSNVFHKSHSPVKRTFNQRTAPKNSNLKEKVNIAKVNNATTIEPKAVVSVVQGHKAHVVKASASWIWIPKQNLLDHGNPQHALKDQGIVDSGCSSHMTGYKAYLSDYQEINGGFVAFGGSPKRGKITGKGKIRTKKLDFDDVYFVKELKFNLFSVSQMCDKKNSALFTETECLVLSPNFKLLDESQVLLKIHR
ncbi:hypothetical protein Tco_0093542 [Tanacetum coccineum]